MSAIRQNLEPPERLLPKARVYLDKGKRRWYLKTPQFEPVQENGPYGREYRGRISLPVARLLARYSPVVRSIVRMLIEQTVAAPWRIVPASDQEPPYEQFLLNYSYTEIHYHPALDPYDKQVMQYLLAKYSQTGGPPGVDAILKMTDAERGYVRALQKKHEEFYRRRFEDTESVSRLLLNPNPEERGAEGVKPLLRRVLRDTLELDRGMIRRIFDNSNPPRLVGLDYVDGAYLKPILGRYGFEDKRRAYVYEINGELMGYFAEDEIIPIIQYPSNDPNNWGYGESPVEALYVEILTDLYVNRAKKQLFESPIPSTLLVAEPPGETREGIPLRYSQDLIDSIERKISMIMQGNPNAVPMVSGVRLNPVNLAQGRDTARFVEIQDHVVTRICSAYGISKQDLNLISDLNRSTAEVMAEASRNRGLRTLMEMTADALTRGVVNFIRPQGDLRFAFEVLDTNEEKARLEIAERRLRVGLSTINDVLREENRPLVPWGYVPLAPGSWRPWQPTDPSRTGGEQTSPLDALLGGVPAGPAPGAGAPGAPGAPGMAGADPQAQGLPPGALPGLPGMPAAGAPGQPPAAVPPAPPAAPAAGGVPQEPPPIPQGPAPGRGGA